MTQNKKEKKREAPRGVLSEVETCGRTSRTNEIAERRRPYLRSK